MENKPVTTGGRPPAINPTIMQKLIGALQRGFSNEEACEIAGISEKTFYKYQKQPWFLQETTDAKNYSKMLAGETVFDVLQDIHRTKYDEDTGVTIKRGKYSPQARIDTAKWFLERQSKAYVTKELNHGGTINNTQNNYQFISAEQISKTATELGTETMDTAELLEALTTKQDGNGGAAEGTTMELHQGTLQDDNSKEGDMF
jgi:hypothetical protein